MDDGYMNWLKVWRAIEEEITSNPAHAKLAKFFSDDEQTVDFSSRRITVSAAVPLGIASDIAAVLRNHFDLAPGLHFNVSGIESARHGRSEVHIDFTDAGVDKALEKCPPPPSRNNTQALVR